MLIFVRPLGRKNTEPIELRSHADFVQFVARAGNSLHAQHIARGDNALGNQEVDEEFGRLVMAGERDYWMVMTLPNALLGGGTFDTRWTALRQEPAWQPLYQLVREAVLRDRQCSAIMFIIALTFFVLTTFIIMRLFVSLNLITFVFWAILTLGVLPIVAAALVLLVGIAFYGIPVKYRHSKLGYPLTNACVADELLYRRFVESGILRIQLLSLNGKD